MAARGQAYTELVELVRRRGALHPKESETLFDAADALLFGEDHSEDKALKANDTLDSLAEAERWTESQAEKASKLLALIGG